MGTLNFFNAFLTGILTRKRESVVFGPILSRTMEGIFRFYTYHPTVTPILPLIPIFILLGCALPLLIYRAVSRLAIVERLREAET